jgi:hypothetical protein
MCDQPCSVRASVDGYSCRYLLALEPKSTAAKNAKIPVVTANMNISSAISVGSLARDLIFLSNHDISC